ncbi:elongation factor P [Candidatus Uhrbacteria bacterium RIFCSPHIGHO2_12_FULL_54_23]|uniref:Elongation factor P n=3 Tax=Candidatus Uhriibacteriota TaxID=1752732 RepID=A0A1F7UHZ3_9BACT|nr:MAG: elongation factor P [Candidatus Uhrbacteria bacterium RIFCSPHIGHO2_12_FULL_54_23]OGL85547.1 MAG: elongation factor P [Candidatus Uhrbacteria bacterium RIFCSPLOWO2_01_FULL_55_36]OGL89519.1 MAG: elongation factor P [Candidatus Uhrbacteria bacterium RIFCSPLOWO2_02_FULL_54_37]
MAVLSSLNDIKKGIVLNYQGEPYIIMEASFMRMQQRKPVMQTKMRSLRTGKVTEYSFKPGETVEEADIARKKASFLYAQDNQYYFMDLENYDQFFVNSSEAGDGKKFLKEGQEVEVLLFEEAPISVQLPKKIELAVTEAGSAVKGDTASGNVTKEITLETGAVIRVPLFVKEGDIVRINTDTGEYTERVTN